MGYIFDADMAREMTRDYGDIQLKEIIEAIQEEAPKGHRALHTGKWMIEPKVYNYLIDHGFECLSVGEDHEIVISW